MTSRSNRVSGSRSADRRLHCVAGRPLAVLIPVATMKTRLPDAALTILTLTTLAAAWVVLGEIDALRVLVLVTAATAVQLGTLRWRSRSAFAWPATVVLILNTVGAFGFLYYRSIADVALVSADLPDTDIIYGRAAVIFVLASVGFWAGALIFRGAPGGDGAGGIKGAMQSVPTGLVVVAGVGTIVGTVVGRTPGALMERPYYLAAFGPHIIVSAASMATPVAVALLAFAAQDRSRKMPARLTCWALLAAETTLLFILGTRMISMLPALLLLASHVRDRARWRQVVAMLLTGVATAGLLQLPLSMRGHGSAGWRPFTERLAADPLGAVTPKTGPLAGNVLFALPLSATVQNRAGGELPDGYVATTFSPLPGALTDWPSMHLELGINRSTPYSGLGELAALGPGWVLGVGVAIGSLLSLLWRLTGRLTPAARAIVTAAGHGMIALFTLDLLQYNLRTGVRLIWYLMLLVAAASFVLRAQPRILLDSRRQPPIRPPRWAHSQGRPRPDNLVL